MRLLEGLLFFGWLLGNFIFALYLVYKLFRAPVIYPWWKRVLLLALSIGLFYALLFADLNYHVLSFLPGSFEIGPFSWTYAIFLSMVYGLPILYTLGLLWCFNVLRTPPVLIFYCSGFVDLDFFYLGAYFIWSS